MRECYHRRIDARLLRLVEATVSKIDAQPDLRARISLNVARWKNQPTRARWKQLLRLPWQQLRRQLLADDETGAALRQDAPMGGILTPAERLKIMREFSFEALKQVRRG